MNKEMIDFMKMTGMKMKDINKMSIELYYQLMLSFQQEENNQDPDLI